MLFVVVVAFFVNLPARDFKVILSTMSASGKIFMSVHQTNINMGATIWAGDEGVEFLTDLPRQLFRWWTKFFKMLLAGDEFWSVEALRKFFV